MLPEHELVSQYNQLLAQWLEEVEEEEEEEEERNVSKMREIIYSHQLLQPTVALCNISP